MSNYIGILALSFGSGFSIRTKNDIFEFAALSEHEHVDTAMKAEWSLAALSEHEHVDTAVKAEWSLAALSEHEHVDTAVKAEWSLARSPMYLIF